MLIYLITNKINNKQYVGLTTTPLDVRWKRHVHAALYKKGKRTYINNSIQKYGPENFEIKEIDSSLTLEELKVKESEWILKLKTLSPFGYNLIVYDNSDRIITESTRKKCGDGGRKAWENVRNNPASLAKRKQIGQDLVKIAKIKNRERRGLKPQKKTLSIYVGVTPYKNKGRGGIEYTRWTGIYNDKNGKTISRCFDTEDDAAKFRDKGILRNFGDKERLNFSLETYESYINTGCPEEKSSLDIIKDKNLMENYANSGRLLSDIAKEINVDPETVSRYFRKHGLKHINPIQYKLNMIDKNYLARLVWEKPIIEIEKEIGLCQDVIRRFCKENNITYPKRGRPKAER